MLSFQGLQHNRLKHYSGFIRVLLLTVFCCATMPVNAASQPPKILSVKVPSSIDVGKLFEVEIKVLDESGLDRIQVEFAGKTSRIRGRGKKSYTFKEKFKSSEAGRKTMKITAINLLKLKSNVYRKRINVQALKETTQTHNNAPSKSSIGNSKKTTGLGKVTTVKPVIVRNKLNTRNGGKLVGKPVAPSTKMDVVKPTIKQKSSGSRMQPLVASPDKSQTKLNLAPSSLGIKAAVKPGITKPGSLGCIRPGTDAAKLSI